MADGCEFADEVFAEGVQFQRKSGIFRKGQFQVGRSAVEVYGRRHILKNRGNVTGSGVAVKRAEDAGEIDFCGSAVDA